ncbi:Gfo/Idh/MocA family protein [Maritalea sp.]|uniref:Gfo/Idh/MocA family protein n=1 Tax=Maritalea sp. TaxID=2003361 RepID=UPI003EF70A8B
MKIAIAGIGYRSVKVLGYLQQAMPEIEFTGYVDPNPTLLSQLCDPNSIRAFDNVSDMLDDSNVDLLFVGSPNHLHLEHIEAGLRAGVQVFTEKPVVASMEQTWELAKLLKEFGPERVMVGLVLRYAPQMIDLKNALDLGVLGEVVSLEANEHIEPAHGAFFMRDWRRYSHYSGGFMLEKCVHDLDLYSMITNSRPIKVASFGGRQSFLPGNAPVSNADNDIYHSKTSIWEGTNDPFTSDGDIIDYQTALISYESGATLAFHTNLNIPDEHRRFLVAGTKGMAEGDFQRGYLKVTHAPSGKIYADVDYTKRPEALIDHYGADAQMGKDIAAYLRQETGSLPVSISDALEAGIVAMAIDEARNSGEMFDLKPIWARFDEFGLSPVANNT